MSHFPLPVLLIVLLMQSFAASSENCSAVLSDDFNKDCQTYRLSNYSQCLRDTKTLNPTIIANELNGHYCKSGDCDFFCAEDDGKISCSCMCADMQEQRIHKRDLIRHKRGVITCNDCFKIEIKEMNIGM